MASILARRIRDKFWPETLPTGQAFAGKTVLITGGTSGLGRAAAIHFVRLGAKIVITSRNFAHGGVTARSIETETGLESGQISVKKLDMGRYASCTAFVDELRHEYGPQGIDYAIFNAGVIQADYEESPEGWEQTIQVNALSTALVGFLLFSWMKQAVATSDRKCHLIFVTSRDHTDPDLTTWPLDPGKSILEHLSSPENWPTNQFGPNYANSKLILTYVVEELCRRAVNTNTDDVSVIINSVCPGLVSTSMGQSIMQKSLIVRLVVPGYLLLFGKSPDYGARFYVSAALKSEKQHGDYIQSLFAPAEYQRLATPNLKSAAAVRVKAKVLNEIFVEFRKKIPRFDEMVHT